MADLKITCIGDTHCIIETLEGETGVTLVIEEIMGIIHKVAKGIGTIIMTIGEAIIEVKITLGIEVGHYIGRTEVG